MRESMGIDQPLHRQFVTYMTHLLHGDLGHSYKTGNSVVDDLKLRLPATLELALASMLVAFPVGVVLGVLGAAHPRSSLDFFVRGFGIFGNGVAVFWLGLMLIYVFYFRLGIAPAPAGRLGMLDSPPSAVTGFYTIDILLAGDLQLFRSGVTHLVMPVICLSLVVSAPISGMTHTVVS